MRATRMAAYYNTTSDWMAWVQAMNESDTEQALTLYAYDLGGQEIVRTEFMLSPHQTQTIPLESLMEVKGKQGMVVLASQGGSIAACLISRKASQPDYTSTSVPFSTTLLAL